MKSSKLEDYKICYDKLLGKGATAQVYYGINIKTKSSVAVKIIAKKKVEDKILLYITKELENLRRVEGPNIVQLFDVIEENDQIFVILEYCNGTDIASLITNKKFISQDQAIQYLREFVEGYKILYVNNIIHRDIKPANLLIHNDHLKIADFGFSKHIGDMEKLDEIGEQTIVGTPYYMAPQLLNGSGLYTSKYDIWSLGITFYSMILGELPWPSATLRQLEYNICKKPFTFPMKKTEFKFKPEIKDLLDRMLKTEEDDRISWPELFDHPLIAGNIPKNSMKLPSDIPLQDKQKEAENYAPKNGENEDMKQKNADNANLKGADYFGYYPENNVKSTKNNVEANKPSEKLFDYPKFINKQPFQADENKIPDSQFDKKPIEEGKGYPIFENKQPLTYEQKIIMLDNDDDYTKCAEKKFQEETDKKYFNTNDRLIGQYKQALQFYLRLLENVDNLFSQWKLQIDENLLYTLIVITKYAQGDIEKFDKMLENNENTFDLEHWNIYKETSSYQIQKLELIDFIGNLKIILQDYCEIRAGLMLKLKLIINKKKNSADEKLLDTVVRFLKTKMNTNKTSRLLLNCIQSLLFVFESKGKFDLKDGKFDFDNYYQVQNDMEISSYYETIHSNLIYF